MAEYGYDHFNWPYNRVTGVITIVRAGRNPTCKLVFGPFLHVPGTLLKHAEIIS